MEARRALRERAKEARRGALTARGGARLDEQEAPEERGDELTVAEREALAAKVAKEAAEARRRTSPFLFRR